MQLWISLLFLAPALLAQSQAPDPLQELQQRLDRLTPLPVTHPGNFLHLPAQPGTKAGNPAPGSPSAAPGQMMLAKAKPNVCSIPLINALKGKPGLNDKIAISVEPWMRAHFQPGNYVTPPAPPCDDMRR
jgi:hypothetical protein